jgi:hypothetical protein
MRCTATERFWLGLLAFVSIAGLNGVFVWALLARPDLLQAAMQNPVAAVFIVEALVMTGVLAYFLNRWQVSRLHWAWFVGLSLLGGLAFALPVVLLWSDRRQAISAAGGGSITSR